MDNDALKKQVKEWKASYDAFNRMEVELRRQYTFAQRLRDLAAVLAAANEMPSRERPLIDEAIMNRWKTIRQASGK